MIFGEQYSVGWLFVVSRPFIAVPKCSLEFRVSISHLFLFCETRNKAKQKSCYAKFRLFRETTKTAKFRFVSSKAKFRFVSKIVQFLKKLSKAGIQFQIILKIGQKPIPKTT
jgi:hypothetical protein